MSWLHCSTVFSQSRPIINDVEFPFIAGLQKSLLKNVGLCGGFRFLVSGCTKVDFLVGGGFRGFPFLCSGFRASDWISWILLFRQTDPLRFNSWCWPFNRLYKFNIYLLLTYLLQVKVRSPKCKLLELLKQNQGSIWWWDRGFKFWPLNKMADPQEVHKSVVGIEGRQSDSWSSR